MPTQVPTLEEFQQLAHLVVQLRDEVAEVRFQLPEWIDQKEACRLTGQSRTWFFAQRQAGRLPVAYKKTGARSLLYSRADCVVLGLKNLILPPAHVATTQNAPASPSS